MRKTSPGERGAGIDSGIDFGILCCVCVHVHVYVYVCIPLLHACMIRLCTCILYIFVGKEERQT